jgi:hypothetical protein
VNVFFVYDLPNVNLERACLNTSLLFFAENVAPGIAPRTFSPPVSTDVSNFSTDALRPALLVS